jgi:hypothetical protein
LGQTSIAKELENEVARPGTLGDAGMLVLHDKATRFHLHSFT